MPPQDGGSRRVTIKGVTAQSVALRDVNVNNFVGTESNPGLQKIISSCLSEMEAGTVSDIFFQQLQHFNRAPSERNLKIKLSDAGKNDAYYDYAIEAKESFAKFFEVVARHPSGQRVLLAAFSHAYSVFREKIQPNIEYITFDHQAEIFEKDVVLFLSHNLTGMPGFYGRNEALGLLYFLADNCFIEYANV